MTYFDRDTFYFFIMISESQPDSSLQWWLDHVHVHCGLTGACSILIFCIAAVICVTQDFNKGIFEAVLGREWLQGTLD